MRNEISAGLLWYGRAVAATGVTALVTVAILQTGAGWEFPRSAYPIFSAAVGTLVFGWVSLRPPAVLARDDGEKVLFVLAGLAFVTSVLLGLSTIGKG